MSEARTSTFAGVGTAYVVDPEELEQDDDQEGDDAYVIHGIAIGVGDVTVGQSGVKKKWPADALRAAAGTLEGKPLVRDHLNSTTGQIGEVTHAEFVEDIGVIYEAEIAPHYKEQAQDVRAGLLDVSIQAYHAPEDELSEDPDTGALIVEDVYFDNLSTVTDGASPSNTANTGPVDNILDDPGHAEATAVVNDTHATATLERSADVSQDAIDSADLALNVADTPTEGEPFAPDHDDVFESRADAEARGEELGCGADAHEVELDGETTYFVPCASMSEYQDVAENDYPADDTNTGVGAGTETEAETERETELEREQAEETSHSPLTFNAEAFAADERETDELGAPEGIYTAGGTWFAVAPSEHNDDSTEWADDAKYPLTSCTGENSVEAAWKLRGHGDMDISEDTLANRIQRAAEAMDCDSSIVGLDEDDGNSNGEENAAVEEAASMDELDEVYSDWDSAVNMTASELERWSENPCSREASVDADAVIDRNMRLLETDKDEWDTNDIEDAKRTISFIERMASDENRPESPQDGAHGCPSKWAISLLNWAYNPFDSVPDVPDEMDDESASGNTATQTTVAETAESYGPDHDDVFDARDAAIQRAQELGLDAVHEHEFDGNAYYMPGSGMEAYEGAVDGSSSTPTSDDEDGRDDDEDSPDEDGRDDNESASGHESDSRDTGVASLADVTMHEPQYEETSERGEFSAPSLDDWSADSWDKMDEPDRDAVSEHFMLSESGFPPDSFEDLHCPVVDADGTLHLDALEREFETLQGDHDYPDDVADEALDWVVTTAEEEFGVDLNSEMGAHGDSDDSATGDDDMDTNTDEYSSVVQSLPVARRSSSDATRTARLDSIRDMIEYESADTDELSDDLDEPVVVERAELEDMAEQAEKADNVEEELEQLSAKLDEQDDASEIVEQLSDDEIEMVTADEETSIVEAGKVEMFDEVTEIYAEELADYSPFGAEELADRFSPTELKDRVEEHEEASLASSIDDVEPEPDAGNADDEELSSGSGSGDDESEEELRETYAAELESQGWTTQAEKVRSGELDVVDSDEV